MSEFETLKATCAALAVPGIAAEASVATEPGDAMAHLCGFGELRNLLPDNLLDGTPAIREAAAPECRASGQLLVNRLSFTHFTELLAIDDDVTRTFYEIECGTAGRSSKFTLAALALGVTHQSRGFGRNGVPIEGAGS